METMDYFEWLSYIFAFIGLIATIKRTIHFWVRIKSFSWKDVDRLSKKLIEKIIHDGYCPEVIVGIGRGGAIVGAILSGNLKFKKENNESEKKGHIHFLGVDRIYEWKNNVRFEVDNKMVSLDRLAGKRVLLVAGDVMAGNTVNFFINKLKQAQVASIKTACLVKSTSSTHAVSYYAREIPSRFRMPWMYKYYERDSRENIYIQKDNCE